MTYTEMSKIIRKCYLSGNFEPMLELMTDDYQHHSFWLLDPIEGRENLEQYYRTKGKAIAESDGFCAGRLVKIADPFEGGRRGGNFVVFADIGKVCVLFAQECDGKIIHTLAIPTLTEDGRLKQLCITEPALYNLRAVEAEWSKVGKLKI